VHNKQTSCALQVQYKADKAMAPQEFKARENAFNQRKVAIKRRKIHEVSTPFISLIHDQHLPRLLLQHAAVYDTHSLCTSDLTPWFG
jgi:hypothetical protein